MLFKIPMNCLLYVNFCDAKIKKKSCFWMQMALWVFCELSPPIIIAPQAGIRGGLIALQALLKNRASFLASQAIRSTFSTQITPVPSTLLCARSEDKERDICWMSVQLSASVALQPDALKTGRTEGWIDWSLSREDLCCKSAPEWLQKGTKTTTPVRLTQTFQN